MKFSDVKKTCTTVKYSLMLMREMDDRCFAEPGYLVLMEQEGSIFVPERLREIECLPTLKALLNSYCSWCGGVGQPYDLIRSQPSLPYRNYSFLSPVNSRSTVILLMLSGTRSHARFMGLAYFLRAEKASQPTQRDKTLRFPLRCVLVAGYEKLSNTESEIHRISDI